MVIHTLWMKLCITRSIMLLGTTSSICADREALPQIAAPGNEEATAGAVASS